MPGFIDTHHHQFETALRSFLADGLLFNDGLPHGAINYFQYILGTFAGSTGRKTCTSASWSARSASSTRGSRRRTTSRRSTTRSSTRTPRSRAAPTPGGASSSAISRVPAPTCRDRLQVRPTRRCAPHQEEVLLLQRSAHDDDHGRRDLPPAAARHLHARLEDRPRAPDPRRGAHRRQLRHAAGVRRDRHRAAGRGSVPTFCSST